MDNPFKESSRSYRLFEVLANADRPLRPDELVGAVGETDTSVAHSMLKDLRGRGISVFRYRDPEATSPTASVYSLRPVQGFTELTTAARPRRSRPPSGPPAAVRPDVRQPTVGSVARVIAVALHDDALHATFECDGLNYQGAVAGAQPSVGEWLTVVTVGLHGHGLYAELAGARVVTIENLQETKNG